MGESDFRDNFFLSDANPGYALGLTSWQPKGKVSLKKYAASDKSIFWDPEPGDNNHINNASHYTLNLDAAPVGNVSNGAQLEVQQYEAGNGTQSFAILYHPNG